MTTESPCEERNKRHSSRLSSANSLRSVPPNSGVRDNNDKTRHGLPSLEFGFGSGPRTTRSRKEATVECNAGQEAVVSIYIVNESSASDSHPTYGIEVRKRCKDWHVEKLMAYCRLPVGCSEKDRGRERETSQDAIDSVKSAF